MSPTEIMTYENACKQLACGRTTLYKLISEGALKKCNSIGRKGVLTAESVHRVKMRIISPLEPERKKRTQRNHDPKKWDDIKPKD